MYFTTTIYIQSAPINANPTPKVWKNCVAVWELVTVGIIKILILGNGESFDSPLLFIHPVYYTTVYYTQHHTSHRTVYYTNHTHAHGKTIGILYKTTPYTTRKNYTKNLLTNNTIYGIISPVKEHTHTQTQRKIYKIIFKIFQKST